MIKDVFHALGLEKNPFSMAANTDEYFQTDATKRILEELAYGIAARKGFLLLVGEVGVGKTALLYQLMKRMDGESSATALVFNTMLGKEDLLKAVAGDFGLSVSTEIDFSGLIDLLQRFFIQQNEKGRNCAIIVDEAHNLSLESLETLRMLSNLEASGEKLAQILLVGQPELKCRLEEENLRQLRSRIAIYEELRPFDVNDTHDYVNFKLAGAGSNFRMSGERIKLLYKATKGNTRMINMIMERALYASVALGDRKLTARVVRSAAQEIAGCQTEVAVNLGRTGSRSHAGAAMIGMAAAALVGMLALTVTHFAEIRQMAGRFVDLFDDEPAEVEFGLFDEGSLTGRGSLPEATGPAARRTPLPDRDVEVTDEMEREMRAYVERLGLPHLLPALREAVTSADPEVFRRRLPADYEMVQLPELPIASDVECEKLPWRHLTGYAPNWLIVWRPPLAFSEFYYGQRDGGIRSLQKQLRKLGYYRGRMDGLLGKGTLRAMAEFQKDMRLTRTSIPDADTIFWLFAKHKDAHKSPGES